MGGVYKAKDLVVVIEKKRLKVGVKGQPLIIDGDFPKEVKLDDCTWCLEDKKTLLISLEKVWNIQRMRFEEKIILLSGEPDGMVEPAGNLRP